MSADGPAVLSRTLGWLVSALDRAMVDLVLAPDGVDVHLRTHALVTADDLGYPLAQVERDADVILLVGVRGADALPHLSRFSGTQTRVILVKCSDDGEALRSACEALRIALVVVNPEARWEQVHRLVGQLLRQGPDNAYRAGGDVNVFGTHNDLFGLATSIAALTGGLVTIDDPDARVLAFSPIDETADDIRRVSILGRGAPASYLKLLRTERIYQRLQQGEVIDFRPGKPLHRRLVAGVRASESMAREYYGAIWVQERDEPLHEDAWEVLRMATRYAAHLIGQIKRIPSAEQASVRHHLLGDDDAIPPSIDHDHLGIDAGSRSIVAAFEASGPDAASWLTTTHASGLLALHATAFRDRARIASIGARLYAVLPDIERSDTVLVWANKTVTALSKHIARPVIAAVSEPAQGLAELPTARLEVDNILDAAPEGKTRVVTIDDTRTSVILHEALRRVNEEVRAVDPRFQLLLSHDETQHADLVPSVRVYLDELGDVRRAADRLHVHPNTLRHRIRRAEEISGIDLGDADSRLLLQLQLRSVESPSGHTPPRPERE